MCPFFQWYYGLAADYFETSPQHKSIYKNVSVTGKCTGLDSDPLVQAILAQQRDLWSGPAAGLLAPTF